MITRAVVQSHKDQVEQVQRPCVCVVRCIYNTRLSLATVSVLLLYCSSLEEVLFIKSFKTSSPWCAIRSCLCGQEFPSNLLSLTLDHFSGLNSPTRTHTPQLFFMPKQDHYLLHFIVFVGCFHCPMEIGLQASLISVESLSMPSLLLVFQKQKSCSVAF